MNETTADAPISIVKSYPFIGPRHLAVVLSMTLAVMASFAGYGRARFGSFAATLDFARGEAIIVDERFKTINGALPGSVVEAAYAVTNTSGRPLKLIGAVPSCTCSTVLDLPFTFAPWETKTVTVRIKVSETARDVSGTMRLFTDEPRSPEIVLNYIVRAVAVEEKR